MRHDDGVPVVIGNLSHTHGDAVFVQVVDVKHLGGGVHHLDFSGHAGAVGVMGQQHGLLGDAVAARLHGDTAHGEGLAGADFVGVERAAVHQRAPDGIDLMLAQVERATAQAQSHAVEVQEGAVVLGCGVGVARLVVFRLQACAALGVRPQPFTELGADVPNTGIGFVRGLGVHVLIAVAVLAADFHRLIGECGIDQLAEWVLARTKSCARFRPVVCAVGQANLPAAIEECGFDTVRAGAVEHVGHVLGVGLGGHPGGAQLAFDVEVRHILGDDLFQLGHVALHGLVAIVQRGLGFAQLLAHVARQVNVGGHHVAIGRLKHCAGLHQGSADFCLGLTGQGGNLGQAGLNRLVAGQHVGILRRRILDTTGTANRALTQDVRRLAVDRERGQGRVKRIVNLAQVVQAKAIGHVAVGLSESLVGFAQRLAGVVGLAVALGLDQRGVLAAHVDQRAQLLLTLGRGRFALEGVLAHFLRWGQVLAAHHVQLSVLLAQRALAVGGVVGHVADVLGTVFLGEHALWHQIHRVAQALGHVLGAMDDHAGLHARGAVAVVGGADHVAGVLRIELVDEDLGACGRLDGHGIDPRLVGRQAQWFVALLEDHDVRHYAGAGVFLKSARRQANRRDQLGLARQRGTDAGRLLVHGAVGRDAHHQAAGANLIQRLQEKVIVQERTQGVVAAVGNDGVLEWPVADHHVIEVVRRLGLLVAHHLDVRVRVQASGHGAGQAVQLDPRQLAAALDVGRHHAEEVADAHGWLQHAATTEAHALDHIPHGHHGGWVGVVGVGNGALGRFPFVLPQVVAQPLVALLPPLLGHGLGPGALEQLLPKRTPAGVTGQRALFFCGGLALALAQRVQQLDGCHVLVETGYGRAADDFKGVVQVEVAGAGVGRADFLGRLYAALFSGSNIRCWRSACSRASVTGIPDFISLACSSHIRCWHTNAIASRTP